MSDTTSLEYRVLLYYKYVPIEDAEAFRKEHKKMCQELDLMGRILIGDEGINGTVSGLTKDTEEYKRRMHADERFADMPFKEDESEYNPFRKLKVKTRPEIVTLGVDGMSPEDGGKHLAPKEWHEMAQQEDVVVLDARNEYEWRIGRFKNAVLPKVDLFKEFPQWVEEHQQDLQGKKVLMYCTGGIRCERASTLVKEITGNDEVYQLEGGIHAYGQEIPDGLWEGSMYVFDDRVKVQINDDAHHEIVSECMHCGTPSEHMVNCCNVECNDKVVICEQCMKLSNEACSESCSKKNRRGLQHPWKVPAARQESAEAVNA